MKKKAQLLQSYQRGGLLYSVFPLVVYCFVKDCTNSVIGITFFGKSIIFHSVVCDSGVTLGGMKVKLLSRYTTGSKSITVAEGT